MRKTLLLFFIPFSIAMIPLIGKNETNRNAPAPKNIEHTYRVILGPSEKTILSAEIRTRITKIHKKIGEPFKTGEPLIDLDKELFEGQHIKAKAIFEKAKVELKGRQQLYQDKVSSLFELKRAEADYAIALSELITAEKALKATTISAPYAGKVYKVNNSEHEMTQVGEQLIEILDDHILIARMLLPSSMIGHLSPRSKFHIQVEETGETIVATIKRMSSAINPVSSTLIVESEIDNSSGKLTAGMKGLALFKLPIKTENE